MSSSSGNVNSPDDSIFDYDDFSIIDPATTHTGDRENYSHQNYEAEIDRNAEVEIFGNQRYQYVEHSTLQSNISDVPSFGFSDIDRKTPVPGDEHETLNDSFASAVAPTIHLLTLSTDELENNHMISVNDSSGKILDYENQSVLHQINSVSLNLPSVPRGEVSWGAQSAVSTDTTDAAHSTTPTTHNDVLPVRETPQDENLPAVTGTEELQPALDHSVFDGTENSYEAEKRIVQQQVPSQMNIKKTKDPNLRKLLKDVFSDDEDWSDCDDSGPHNEKTTFEAADDFIQEHVSQQDTNCATGNTPDSLADLLADLSDFEDTELSAHDDLGQPERDHSVHDSCPDQKEDSTAQFSNEERLAKLVIAEQDVSLFAPPFTSSPTATLNHKPQFEMDSVDSGSRLIFTKGHDLCNQLEDFCYQYAPKNGNQIQKSVADVVSDVADFDIRFQELNDMADEIEKINNVTMRQQLQNARSQLLNDTDWGFVIELRNEIKKTTELYNFGNQIQLRIENFENQFVKVDGSEEEENTTVSEILNELNSLSARLAEPLMYITVCDGNGEMLKTRFASLLGQLQTKKRTFGERQAQQVVSELSAAISVAKNLPSFDGFAESYHTLQHAYAQGVQMIQTSLPCEEKTRFEIQDLLSTANELNSQVENSIQTKTVEFQDLYAKVSLDMATYLNEFEKLNKFKGSINGARRCAKMMTDLKNKVQNSKNDALEKLQKIADDLKLFSDSGEDLLPRCEELKNNLEKTCKIITDELDIVENEIRNEENFESHVQRVVKDTVTLIVPEIIKDAKAENKIENQQQVLVHTIRQKKALDISRKHVVPGYQDDLESLLEKFNAPAKCIQEFLKVQRRYAHPLPLGEVESDFAKTEKICLDFEQVVGGDSTFRNALVAETDAERKLIDIEKKIDDCNKNGATASVVEELKKEIEEFENVDRQFVAYSIHPTDLKPRLRLIEIENETDDKDSDESDAEDVPQMSPFLGNLMAKLYYSHDQFS